METIGLEIFAVKVAEFFVCERDTTMMRWTIGLGVLLLSSLSLMSNTALASRTAQPVSTPSACDHETLSQLNKAQLRIKRNTVFARHGRLFKSADLNQYFRATSWYKPNPHYTDSLLTKADKACIQRVNLWERGPRPRWTEHIDFNGDSKNTGVFVFDTRLQSDEGSLGNCPRVVVAVENETLRPCVSPKDEGIDDITIRPIDINKSDKRKELLIVSGAYVDEEDPEVGYWFLVNRGQKYVTSTLEAQHIKIEGDGILRTGGLAVGPKDGYCVVRVLEHQYRLEDGAIKGPKTVVMKESSSKLPESGSSAGCSTPACPFVEVSTQQGWVRVGEILRHINSPEKKSWDRIPIFHSGGRLTIRLLEEKAEITKLDVIGIRTEDGFILPTTCGNALANWCKLDGSVFEMVEGDIQVFHFDLPLQALGRVFLEAYGHYEPL